MTELKRVLCAEDDPDIRMILEFSLGQLGGYTLCMCEDGQEVVTRAVEFAPDLILLDVMMPRLTGPEALMALRALPATARVPVVFLTAKAMPDQMEQLLQYGATGVIVKPFDPVRLPKDIVMYWEHGRACLVR